MRLNRFYMAAAVLAALGVGARAQDTSVDLTSNDAPPNAIWLESLGLGSMTAGWGTPQSGHSADNNPLRLYGVTYPHGVGTHAASEMVIDLRGSATSFSAMVGVDDEKSGHGSVVFEVRVDGHTAARTPVLHGGDPPQHVTVDLTGARRLDLRVDDGGDGIDSDHADWAGAVIFVKPGAATMPKARHMAAGPPPPIIFPDSPVPAIHGPRITGATPGRAFLFRVPATGAGPLNFSAKGLPAGLRIDKQTGIISGSLKSPGTTQAAISVRGPRGVDHRILTIVAGYHKLARTPPMGWNSWNVWAGAVDDAKVRAAADAMVSSGLAAHGFQYINIDDTWEGHRDANGEITTNNKFPDMKALADYVHSKGLKLGIYSSPGPTTCAGFEASYQHELQDARTYAKWGIDYLKYDWCSYGNVATGEGQERFRKPYVTMQQALGQVNRDIVYSLCQYGMGDVWTWGASVDANCWRTTGDINDSWGSLQSIAFSQDGHEKYAGPGHWNDPDMLVVGRVGWGPSLHPTKLTPNEQVTHISMWCLLSSPLLIGCDMTKLDAFTRALLTNDEVLAVNQDPLGKPAGRKSQNGTSEVWARKLWDGAMAVGLVNRDSEPAKVTARWSDLGITGRQPVRNLWLHKELGTSAGSFTTLVPAHGTVLVKIGKPRT